MDKQTQELAPIKQQVTKASINAGALSIRKEEDLKQSTDYLSKIKAIAKTVKERMNAPVKRAYQAYKDIKAEQEITFGGFIADLERAEKIVKNKMLGYNEVVEARAKKKEDAIAEKVESGEMTFEEGSKKTEEVKTLDTKIDGKQGQIQYRTIQKLVIEDETAIPREFLVIDQYAVKKALMAGREVAGAKLVEEKLIAAK